MKQNVLQTLFRHLKKGLFNTLEGSARRFIFQIKNVEVFYKIQAF